MAEQDIIWCLKYIGLSLIFKRKIEFPVFIFTKGGQGIVWCIKNHNTIKTINFSSIFKRKIQFLALFLTEEGWQGNTSDRAMVDSIFEVEINWKIHSEGIRQSSMVHKKHVLLYYFNYIYESESVKKSETLFLLLPLGSLYEARIIV